MTITANIDDANNTSVVQQFVLRASELYTLPAVAMEVLELTNNPDIDATEIKQCIERDPALTTKILRVVNSPVFGLAGQVSDLNQALALLGVKPLKMLVLGFSLPKNLYAGIEGNALKYYWQRSLTKAVAAREVSNLLNTKVGDEAFVAGLLSDLGMMVLLKDLGDPYASFLEKVKAEQVDLLQLEIETLSFDHLILSCRLLQQWGLPESIIQAIQDHTTINLPAYQESSSELVQALTVAEQFTRILVDNQTTLLQHFLDLEDTKDIFSQEEVEQLSQRVEQQVEQLASVMSVELQDDSSYTDIMAKAYQALSTAGEEAAFDLSNPSPEMLAKYSSWNETQVLKHSVSGFQEGTAGDAPKKENISVSIRSENLDPSWELVGKLSQAVERSRTHRSPLSLIKIKVDDYDSIVMQRGLEETDRLLNLLSTAVKALTEGNADCVESNEGLLTFVLEDHDRSEAVRSARNLVEGVSTWSQQISNEQQGPITVSAGVSTVAMPPKNFQATELDESAKRCMQAVEQGGGNGVKSIEIL